jgi:AraC-like DNA-binding protein
MMTIQLNIYAAVLLFAFVQGIFYTYQFSKRGIQDERVSDFWMASLILGLCITNLHSMLGFMGIHILGQELWFFPQSAGLIIGPLVYYYLKTQINVYFKFRASDLRHFLAFIIYFAYHLLVFSSGKNGVDWWAQHVHNRLFVGDLELIAENGSLVLYMALSIRLYRRYLHWLPTERSDTELLRLGWYKNFLVLIILGVLSSFVFLVLGFFTNLSYWDDWVLRAIVAFIICYVSFHAYIQPQPPNLAFKEAAALLPATATTAITVVDTSDNFEKSELKLELNELKEWCQKVETIMQNDKLYLNPELTLSALSERLYTHNALVSYVINKGFQKNFNDFVNAYRVTVFTEKVKDPKWSHYTLLALAFECGFNSKSTFNRAVKKATGLLPSGLVREQ